MTLAELFGEGVSDADVHWNHLAITDDGRYRIVYKNGDLFDYTLREDPDAAS